MDISAITDLVKGGAVAADAVIKTLKGVKELVKKADATPADGMRLIDEKLSEALDQMIRVKEARLELLEAIEEFAAMRSAFDKKLEDVEDFQSKVDHYVMTEISPNSFVYVSQPSEQFKEPRHYACVPCFKKKQISLLQFQEREFNFDTVHCPACGTTARIPNDVKAEVLVASRPVRGLY